MITYEHPLSERIRTLLRLEDLYERALYFIAKADPQEHHVALLCLFEILEVAGVARQAWNANDGQGRTPRSAIVAVMQREAVEGRIKARSEGRGGVHKNGPGREGRVIVRDLA